MSILSSIQILIVDDHEEMALLIALMLRQNNIDVFTEYDGISGFQKIVQDQPDIIITDLMMPGMTGFDLMEKVLKQDAQVPIIVMTAYGSMEAAIKALRLGAFDFITKPFDRTDVRNTIAKAVKQQINERHKNWRQKISNTLSTFHDPIEAGEKLIHLIAEALGIEQGILWWPEEATPPILLHSDEGTSAKNFISWAKTAGLTGQSDNGPTSKFFTSPNDQSSSSFSGSLVGVPLITRKNMIGLVILAHSQAEYFDANDLSFLDSLASFAALAIDNAKTYTKLEASNNKFASLQRISTLTYNANLPLNRVLRLVVEGIRQNLHYPGVILCLPEKTTNNLIIRAAAGNLNRFLQLHGDAPTRRITIDLDRTENPIGLAYQTRKPQEAPVQSWIDALVDADASDMAQALAKLNLTWYIFLPLWQGEEIIGILGIGHSHANPLSPTEWNLLTSVANQTALIIKNASLYQTERQGRREMEALYQAGLAITSSLAHNEVLKTIVEQIVGLTFFESCIIGRWDERKEAEVIELYVQKSPTGWVEKEAAGTVYSLANRPLVKEALTQRQLKVVKPDAPDLPPVEQAWMEHTQTKLRVIIPLIIRSISIGVLELMTTQADYHFSTHISRITEGLAAQAAIALENARLYESEIKRIEQEMDLAQRIQLSLLPHEVPQIPGLNIAARSISARLVGGDFYRYLSLPDGRFGVVVGDVSGKGVPSALYMAMTITAMDTQIRQHTSPGDMLRQLNAVLYPRMHANRMNTALLIAIFNPSTGSLQVANAGMIAPLVKQRRNYNWLDVYGLPIGAIANTPYTSQTVSLPTRSTIILTSDGIIEAQNHAGEMFGFERFQTSAQRMQNVRGSQQVLDGIWGDATEHIGDAEQHDDMTMVVIQTWGKQGGTKPLSQLA